MHAVKKAARRQAWYDDGKSTKTYNPFSRAGPRPGHRAHDDEEMQLQHANTDNDTQSPLEMRRHDFSQAETRDFRGPAKGKTWPAAANGDSRTAVDESPAESSKAEDDVKSLDHTRSIDNTIAPTNQQHVPAGEIDTSAGGIGADGKPRKRRGRKFFARLGLKKSEEKESEPEEKDKSKSKHVKNPNITLVSQLRAIFFSWINILLIAVPVGIAIAHTGGNAIAVFCVNFVAIIPLAALLSYATEELAMYVGEVLGGLLNASFGNAVELIVSVIALAQQKTLIVQTSLVGSMLSNLLLVLGMCFFFGGINRVEQNFNTVVSQTASSLLALAIGSLIIPTAFAIFDNPSSNDDGVTPLSRGTAVILLLVYAAYLIFQLRTHTEVYNAKSEKVPTKKEKRRDAERNGSFQKGIATIGAGTAAASGGSINQENLVSDRTDAASKEEDEEEEEEVPQLTRIGAFLTLAISTAFIGVCAESMVSAIDVLGQDISEEFIGLILLPIVGNAAEHATAVTVAIKDKMDLSIGVAVGSSLQIALLIFPLMILLNWFGIGSPSALNLDLNGFQVAVLFISIILVSYLINDGKSHWLEGVMLMAAYVIIAVSAFFFPVDQNGQVG